MAKGLDVEPQQLDVTDADGIERIVADLRQRPSGLDILVNNAGISMKGFDADVVQQTMAVNFFGPLHLTDALLPVMGTTGRIVMVSSGLGALSCLAPRLQAEFSDPGLTRDEMLGLVNRFQSDVGEGRYRERGWPKSPYSVSKVSMNAVTRILVKELAESDIWINTVDPGWVRTRMGGRIAARSVRKGAETITWAASLSGDGPHCSFLRDRTVIKW